MLYADFSINRLPADSPHDNLSLVHIMLSLSTIAASSSLVFGRTYSIISSGIQHVPSCHESFTRKSKEPLGNSIVAISINDSFNSHFSYQKCTTFIAHIPYSCNHTFKSINLAVSMPVNFDPAALPLCTYTATLYPKNLYYRA